MVAIINYGVGNLMSVARMCEKVGHRAALVSQPSELKGEIDKIILPGVGAFDHGMTCLEGGDWVGPLNEIVLRQRKPVLGICLGMQIMCEASEEGTKAGLSWIRGGAKKFRPGENENLKVPHMGWNRAEPSGANSLIPTDSPQRYYFVHSYYVECSEPSDILATTTYGKPFVSAFRRENIYGVQFHPEKSHLFGMALLKNFLES